MCNEVPMQQDEKYIHVGGNEGRLNGLEETNSHLHSINQMVDKLSNWRSLMESVREEWGEWPIRK